MARIGDRRGAYRVLVGRPEGKRPLGRPRRRLEDNITIDPEETGKDGVEWIDVIQGGGSSVSETGHVSYNSRQKYISIYFNICILRQLRRR